MTNDVNDGKFSGGMFGGVIIFVYFCNGSITYFRMAGNVSSYRPHNPGHDYYAPGVYLITLVVRNRDRNHSLFGGLNNDLKAPAVVLSEIGKVVEEEWGKIPAFEASKGRKVRLHCSVCMPDHFHGVI